MHSRAVAVEDGQQGTTEAGGRQQRAAAMTWQREAGGAQCRRLVWGAAGLLLD